jgi:Ca2+-binding RTX toxin-like protein
MSEQERNTCIQDSIASINGSGKNSLNSLVQNGVLDAQGNEIEHSVRDSKLDDTTAKSAPSRAGTFDIYLKQGLLSPLRGSLDIYSNDLRAEGYDVRISEFSGSAADLRAELKDRWDAESLDGALFVGDLPIVEFTSEDNWSGVSQSTYPHDLYFMDLDGQYILRENAVDLHTGDVGPEIYISRLTSGNLGGITDSSEIELLNAYFEKVHLVRTGQISYGDRGIIFADDSWQDSFASAFSSLYSVVDEIRDANDTTRERYIEVLGENAESLLECIHSWPQGHAIYGNGGGEVTSRDIVSINPKVGFVNMFNCSSANFTVPDNMIGAYTFTSDHVINCIGSTKTGSMLNFEQFYEPQAGGASVGEAFLDWFDANAVSTDSVGEDWKVDWFYGMTMQGDPTLRPAFIMNLEPTRIKERDVNSFFSLREKIFAPSGVIIEANLRADGVDRDYFEIFGLPVGANFEAEVIDQGLDTVLGRFDAQGAVIETDDDGGQGPLSQLAGVVADDGILNLAVSGYPDFDFNGTDDGVGGPHGESGDYELVVRVGGASAREIIGTPENDTLDGTPGDDVIRLLAGNDRSNGLAGNDKIYGDGGNDRLDGGDGSDSVFGGDGNDVLWDAAGERSRVDGGDGNDRIDVTLSGQAPEAAPEAEIGCGAGDDHANLTLRSSAVTATSRANISCGDGNDRVEARLDAGGRSAGSAFAGVGGSGNDHFEVWSASEGHSSNTNNTIDGGSGNDFVQATAEGTGGRGGRASNTAIGGGGDDRLTVEAKAGGGLSAQATNEVYGDEGNDHLSATAVASSVVAGIASNTVHAGGGNDHVITEANASATSGSSSATTTVYGEAGNDTIIATVKSASANPTANAHLLGGVGNDRLTVIGGYDNTLEGGDGDDRLTGSDDKDGLFGGGGNDVAYGGGGDDLIQDGAGNDKLFGAVGSDVFFGGDGDDFIDGGEGNDFARGGGGGGNPDGDDRLLGGGGDDYLVGDRGDDRLLGGHGNDLLIGVDDNASQPGRGEIDTLTGNNGGDRFRLGDTNAIFYMDGDQQSAGIDDYAVIADFDTTSDVIELRGQPSEYVLDDSYSVSGSSGTAILLEQSVNELIGFVRGVADLDIAGDDFAFLGGA